MEIQELCRNASSEILLSQGRRQEGSTTWQTPIFLPKPYAIQHSTFPVIFFRFHVQYKHTVFMYNEVKGSYLLVWQNHARGSNLVSVHTLFSYFHIYYGNSLCFVSLLLYDEFLLHLSFMINIAPSRPNYYSLYSLP